MSKLLHKLKLIEIKSLLNESCQFFMPNTRNERPVTGRIADFLIQSLIAVRHAMQNLLVKCKTALILPFHCIFPSAPIVPVTIMALELDML